MKVEVRTGEWGKVAKPAAKVRDAVFIAEQGISEALEHDGRDGEFLHVVLFADAVPVAAGRMSPEGKIGRVAVLSPYRRKGLGKKVMAVLERLAMERGLPEVLVHAQAAALPFYRALFYTVCGPPFCEAEIVHYRMRKSLFPP